jgi:hypothetical protein
MKHGDRRPVAPVERLRLRGFSPDQIDRLVELKARQDRGEFREAMPGDRLRFARYLVQQGWFNDWGPTRQTRG